MLAGLAYAQADAERELAEKYAPVVRLVEQEEECGYGEPYDPIDIDLILANNEVLFRGPWDRTNVVKVAPSEADLDETRVDYHLDFPGDALEPECDYEKFHRRTIGDSDPTVYGRVITEPGKPGKLALQYWFYYLYNDFNNKHEGDWEMIQLVFDADDAEDALTKAPVAAGYSQHEGAERADWGDDKLEIVDDTHPVVYPAAGSHANFFTPNLFLGRSAAEGVGCDDTTEPHREIRPAVAWVPFDEDAYLAEYPWLGYLGRWGEKQPAFFNGPTGPNKKSQWTKPITWSEEKWREKAFAIPTGGSWNGSATEFFCEAVAGGSAVLTAFTQNPWPVVIVLGVLIVLVFWGASRTQWASSAPRHIARRRAWGQIVAATRKMYTRHFRTFVAIGLLFLPIAIVISGLQAVLFYLSSLEALRDAAGESNAVVAWFTMSFGLLLNLVGLTIVQAATSRVMVTIDAGEKVSVRAVFRSVLEKIWTLTWALVRVVVVVGVLNLIVIGIPLAIWLVGRWAFIGQVIELEGESRRHALRRSSKLVTGRWWKVASIAIVMTGVALVAGPFIGALMLLISDASFNFVNLIAAVIYTFLIPLAAIGTTYVYFDCRVRHELEPLEVTERADVLPAEI